MQQWFSQRQKVTLIAFWQSLLYLSDQTQAPKTWWQNSRRWDTFSPIKSLLKLPERTAAVNTADSNTSTTLCRKCAEINQKAEKPHNKYTENHAAATSKHSENVQQPTRNRVVESQITWCCFEGRRSQTWRLLREALRLRLNLKLSLWNSRTGTLRDDFSKASAFWNFCSSLTSWNELELEWEFT